MHEHAIQGILDQAETMLRRIDNLKKYLTIAKEYAEADKGVLHFLTVEARGSAVVGVCAELEALVRVSLHSCLEALNKRELKLNQIVPSLRRLAVHTVFESLKTLNEHSKLWERRGFTTTLEVCNDVAEFPIIRKHAQPPLDGRTLKPDHFSMIWEVFSLPRDPFPEISWRMSLQKLSGLRNDVAHGNLKFHQIFQQAGTSIEEIERYLDDMAEFSIHFCDVWGFYMESEGYLVRAMV